MKLTAFLIAAITLPAHAQFFSVETSEFVPIDNKVCAQGLTQTQVNQLHKWGLKDGGSIARVETLTFEVGAVCRFAFNSHVVIALKNRSSEAFDEFVNVVTKDAECGTTVPVADIHKMNFIPAGTGKAKSYLAIESGTVTIGCCGAADKENTEVALYDLAAGLTPVYKMKLSNSCEPDAECGGKCLKTDKKDVSHGLKVKVNWDWCEDTCDSQEMKFQDFEHKKKFSQFLTVDANGKFCLRTK